MNPAFEKHAAYLDQAWRTLQDSVLLKRRKTNRLQRGRVQGAIPLVEETPTERPNKLLEDAPVPPPPKNLGDTSSGPVTHDHIRNVNPLTEEERAAQKEIHARMAERAEQALIERKIRELGGGGDDEGSE